MTEVFEGYINKFFKVFVDDLNVHSTMWETHLKHLKFVFLKLGEINLKLNPSKCEFVKINIKFLGHIMSIDGTQPNLTKIKAMTKYHVPIFVINVRAFLGLTTYYRNYVKGYSYIAIPLFELTKNNTMFMWTPQCQNAFNVLKHALVKTPISVRPNFIKTFILDVDWSTKGVDVFLSQKEGRFE
jgi:hypothetical protein